MGRPETSPTDGGVPLNRQSGVPPPKRFFVRCKKCGEYSVSESTAHKFLTEKLKKKLDLSLDRVGGRAILDFLKGCPNCKPDNRDAVVELSIERPKLH